MSRNGEGNGDVEIDIARLIAAVWRRRAAVISLVVLVCVITLSVLSMIPSRYRAETRILIETRDTIAVRSAPLDGVENQYLDQEGVASQVEIMRSTDLIRAVAERLDLTSHPEFSAAASPSLISRVMIILGLEQDPSDAPPGERLVELFREHLKIYQVASSRVIVVQFWSVDRELSAQVANAIADAYLEIQSGAKQVSNADASAWLEPEIQQLGDRVREAEAKVARYRADADLLLVDGNETLVTQQLSDITSELATVRAERANAQARAETVRNAIERGQSTDAFSNVIESEQILRLQDRRASVQSDLADLSTTLLDRHPRMRALRSQLEDIDRQIRSETTRVLSSLENEAEVARVRERELVSQLDELKQTSAQAGDREVELRALEREAAAQRQLLESYLSRYREANSRMNPASLPADARVISRALVPSEPYFPKTIATVIMAGLATLMLASMVIMLRELFAGEGLRGESSAKPLGKEEQYEPEIGEKVVDGPATDMDLTEDTDNAVAEERRATPDAAVNEPEEDRTFETKTLSVRNSWPETMPAPEPQPAIATAAPADAGGQLEKADMEKRNGGYSVSGVAGHLRRTGAPVAVIISPEGDRGSTTSVMLARMLANDGQQALLVDMTGSACPTRMMTMQNDLQGVTNVLVGECSLSEAVHGDRLSAAHIMPQGTADPVQAMSHSSQLPHIVEALSQVYDIVVIECGPTDSRGVRRLLGDENIELIMSVVHPEEDLMTEILTDFHSHGFDNFVVMSPGVGAPPERPDRSAA